MSVDDRLAGRTAIVFGGGHAGAGPHGVLGIGFACASTFAAHGADVVVVDRDRHAADAALGGRFLAVGLAVPTSLRDHLWDAASIATNPVIGYVKHPWPARHELEPPPIPVRDPTMSFHELQTILNRVMPGSVIRHSLGFRHTIAWTKT